MRVVVVVLMIVAAVVGLYLLLRASEAEEKSAEELSAQRAEDAQAARKALEAQCDVGIASACDQLAGLGPTPSPKADPDDPEVQDNEIQEPEIQNLDPDDPERQDPERQQPEFQNPENQNPEDPDAEQQDGDPDDPENQDPEIDDPDPNSLFTFAVRDECDPVPGEFVVDVGLEVEVTSSTVTYVVTCTTASLLP